MSSQLIHCPKCNQSKLRTKFYVDLSRKNKRTVYCKECHLAVSKAGARPAALRRIEEINIRIEHMVDVLDHLLSIKQTYLKGI